MWRQFMKITYIKGENELINEVKPLWEALNMHHQNNAVSFLGSLQSNTFENRHKKFADAAMKVFVEIVKVDQQEKPVGYSISTIDSDGMGELDSLYVEKEYRKLAIGDQLMNNALDWFRENKTKVNRLKVAEGNENVLKFYKKHGFETRFYVLEEVKKEK